MLRTMCRPLQTGASVRCSSYRCGRKTTSSCTVTASWTDGRSAWRGFWVRVPHPSPSKAPPAPFPPCLLLRRSPRRSSRSHITAQCPWGMRWAQDTNVSVGAGLAAHQATPCGITLGSAPRGWGFRGDSGVCMEPEWEGNSSSWGFITGTRLRQVLKRQDLPAHGQEAPRVTEGLCGQEQNEHQPRGLRGLPPGQTFHPRDVC